MGSPAKFGRLRALADEAVDRPGVDELAALLGYVGYLGVALRHMDGLDPQRLGQFRPAAAGTRLLDLQTGVSGDVEQSLLHEMGDQPGIGAMGDHRGGAVGIAALVLQHRSAQRVIERSEGDRLVSV